MRISDWSSDVCSSDLGEGGELADLIEQRPGGREAGAGKPAGLEQIGGRHRAATGGEAGLRERAEDDVGERGEAVQDERERDPKSTRLNSSPECASRMPSSA